MAKLSECFHHAWSFQLAQPVQSYFLFHSIATLLLPSPYPPCLFLSGKKPKTSLWLLQCFSKVGVLEAQGLPPHDKLFQLHSEMSVLISYVKKQTFIGELKQTFLRFASRVCQGGRPWAVHGSKQQKLPPSLTITS